MTRYTEGDRVRATIDMSFGLLSDVEEGERGVVREVEDPWIRVTQYLVRFAGGVEGWVPETNIEPA